MPYDPVMDHTPIRIGIIGGTGLGEALGAEAGEVREVDTPFGKPSSHILLTQWEGVDLALLQRHGIGHTLNPSQVPYRANLFALKALGATHVLASGATGSLRENIAPGDLVIVDQVIDKTHRRANTFFGHAAVHVEFADPFCPVMRSWLIDAASGLEESGLTVHKTGTYVCMEGPTFSTKAESLMHRSWGGDLIGMTAMPEAKLAREAEMAYALIAMPTDYDCWRPHDPHTTSQMLLDEIRGNLLAGTHNNLALMKAALRNVTVLQGNPSPAHSALALAVWSDKEKIDPDEVERLAVLWGRYF